MIDNICFCIKEIRQFINIKCQRYEVLTPLRLCRQRQFRVFDIE
jgi:hypothetical protein